MALLQRISTHKRTRNQYRSASDDNRYVPKAQAGIGMYTIVHGKGSKKKSITIHCSEAEAKKQVALYA